MLGKATEQGDLETVKRLVSESVDIEASGKYWGPFHKRPLILAIRNGHHDISRYLLENGAEVDNPVYGLRPLMEAIEVKDIIMVQLLLKYLATFDKLPSRFGFCKLSHALKHACVKRGDVQTVLFLISIGNDVIELDSHLRTPLFHAVCREVEYGGPDTGLINLLSRTPGVSLDRTDSDGLSLASAAASNGPVTRALIQGGADFWFRDESGRLPLEVDVHIGATDAREAILASRHLKADSDRSNAVREPIYVAAAQVGMEAVVELLAAVGVQGIDEKDGKYGATPIFHAARSGNKEAMRAILRAGDI